MMNIQENNKIGALVAMDYRTASVFKKYGIDFCCQGKRSIQDACEAGGVALKEVIADLNQLKHVSTESVIDYRSWPLDLLADYIEKKHHRYVAEKIEEIQPYLDKVCRVHGAKHPELIEINLHFREASAALLEHMQHEEQHVFSFVRNRVEAGHAAGPNKVLTDRIQKMIQEHSNEGARFSQIAKLSNNYTPPVGACATYRVLYALLQEFENDLHLHIHLENNILFPQIMA